MEATIMCYIGFRGMVRIFRTKDASLEKHSSRHLNLPSAPSDRICAHHIGVQG